MVFITLEEAKGYLRVDFDDDDGLISSLLDSAALLCRDIARLTDAEWEDIDSEKPWSDTFNKKGTEEMRQALKAAILYALAYLYEHREEADHHELTLSLRSLLFASHEGGF